MTTARARAVTRAFRGVLRAVLMAAASAAGLSVLAITDHDNTGGWQPALDARPEDLWLIRGAEFSTVAHTDSWPVSVHLLGYLFDPDHPAIRAEQTRLRAERLHRGMAIVQKMVDDGVPISAEQVMAFADGAPVGRPHIGRALVAAGVVNSVDDAFKTYLAGRGPYYVPKADTDLPTAIEAWLTAGGAHHTVMTRAFDPEPLIDFAEMARIELLLIDETLNLPAFRNEIRWNQAYHHLARGL